MKKEYETLFVFCPVFVQATHIGHYVNFDFMEDVRVLFSLLPPEVCVCVCVLVLPSI